LNAIRRATDVEVDFVVTAIGADAGRLRKRLRIASAKLKTNGMFEWIEAKKTPAISMQHRIRREHLRVDQRMSCEQTVKIPTVPVGPFNHRRDAEAARPRFRQFLLFISHFGSLAHSRCRTVSGSFCPILTHIDTNVLGVGYD
jgi:hypothetical protein